MTSSLPYRQLVLFDGDDGQLSFFKDHEQYLSRIPSYSEWFVFWNDFKMPVYKKFKLILRKYSYIHLCPYYHEDNKVSNVSELVSYLNKLICKFSFILLVHGDHPTYEEVFRNIIGKYGGEKMESETIHKPFSRHLPRILYRMQDRYDGCKYQRYLQNLPGGNPVKYDNESFAASSIYKHNNNSILYDRDEYINLKRIIKSKKKKLNLDIHDLCVSSTEEVLTDSDVNDECGLDNNYSSTEEEELQNCLEHQEPMTQGKSSANMEPFIHHEKQDNTVPVDTVRSTLHKSKNSLTQNQVQMTKGHSNSVDRSLACPKCSKKCKNNDSLRQHYNAKHTSAIINYGTNQSSSFSQSTAVNSTEKNNTTDALLETNDSYDDFPGACQVQSNIDNDYDSAMWHNDTVGICSKPLSLTTTQSSGVSHKQINGREERMKKEKVTNQTIEKAISCSKCNKQCKSDADLQKHFDAKHAQLISPITTKQASSVATQTVSVQNQKKTEVHAMNVEHNSLPSSKSSSKFASPTIPESDLNMNCIRPSPFTSIQVENSPNIQPILTDKQPNTPQQSNNSNITVSCWRCPNKFKLARRRLFHFIKKHAPLVRSKIIELSTNTSNHKESISNHMHNVKTPRNPKEKPFSCWKCVKNFECDNSLLSHFIDKHVSFIISTDADPSDILRDEILMTQERVNNAQNMPTSNITSVSFSQCLRTFKSTEACDDHRKAKHPEPSGSINCSMTSTDVNQVTIKQHETKTVEHINNIVTTQVHRLQHPEMSEVGPNINIYCEAPQTGTNLLLDTKPSTFISSKSTITKKQINITSHTHHRLKTFPCWKCTVEFKSADARLSHFFTYHSTSFLPADNISSNAHICWKCYKSFKSNNSCVSHFISCHAKTILFSDTDPSNILKNQIARVQAQLEARKYKAVTTKVTSICSTEAGTNHLCFEQSNSTPSNASKSLSPLDNQTVLKQEQMKTITNRNYLSKTSCNVSNDTEKLISKTKYGGHSGTKHVKCNLSTTTNSSSDVINRTAASLTHSKSTKTATNSIWAPLCCQQCSKAFTCTAQLLEHVRMEHTEVKPLITSTQTSFTDPHTMKCPKAKLSTLVYMTFGTFQNRISIKFDKKNRCPHNACKSNMIAYDLEQLWLHTNKEHKDAQIKFECCDPMKTYTLKEYKLHRQYYN